MLKYPIAYSDKALVHIWRRHKISESEILAVFSDEKIAARHAKKGRYILTGKGTGGRLVSLVVNHRRGKYRLVTARLSNDSEKGLYEGK